MEIKNASFPIYSESYIFRRNAERTKTVSQITLGSNLGSSASYVIHSVDFCYAIYHIVLKFCLGAVVVTPFPTGTTYLKNIKLILYFQRH